MSEQQHMCITADREWWGSVPKQDRPFACHRRGIRDGARVPEAHFAACDNELCRGCIPRSAVHGTQLCSVCLAKFKDALGRIGWLTAHLRSIESGASNVGERVDTSMTRSILLPDSWDAADELMLALGAPKFKATDTIDQAIAKAHDVVADWWGNIDHRLNTAEGASQAVVTVKRMQNALHRWPNAEAERRHIPGILCPTCGQKKLCRRAPLEYLDDIYVECSTNGCDYRMPWFGDGPLKDGEPDVKHPDYVKGWVDVYAPIAEHMLREEQRAERERRKVRKEAS